MRVGVCRIDILIHQSFSLKDRRRVMNSVKHRLRNRFNISVIEVYAQKLWDRGSFGIALVGEDEEGVRKVLDRVLCFLEEDDRLEVLQVTMDVY